MRNRAILLVAAMLMLATAACSNWPWPDPTCGDIPDDQCQTNPVFSCLVVGGNYLCLESWQWDQLCENLGVCFAR